MLSRPVVRVLLGGALVLLAGCPAGGAMPAPSQGSQSPVQQPPGDDAALSADGKHFAITRTYKGECMPAGSRGGCYSITLEPDGAYSHMLLDAAMTGSYVIEGNQVKLTPGGPATASAMTLSADRTRLDDYVYQPRIEP